MFDTSLRERLNREGCAYLFEGMEQVNIQLTLDELKFHNIWGQSKNSVNTFTI